MTSTGSWTKVKRAPAASRPVNSDARCNPDVPVSRSRRPRIAPTPARTQPFLELLTRRNCSIKRGRQDGGSALAGQSNDDGGCNAKLVEDSFGPIVRET